MNNQQKMSVAGVSEYEWEAWASRLAARPIVRLEYEDVGEGYETNKARLFFLANGKWALVVEHGCSCYDSRNADIEIFPTEAKARAKFDAWLRDKKR